MRLAVVHWAPGTFLVIGVAVTIGLPAQPGMPLRAPLNESVPQEIAGYEGSEFSISEDELQVAGMTEYVLRSYETRDTSQVPSWFSVFIGYYDSQSQGRTIHSPKHCLPGSGWEPVASQRVKLSTATGDVTVNRYLLQRDDVRALVLYWYQGRGRVEANEYTVKWNLLRDAALKRRSDEALVRVVVPVVLSEERAFELAAHAARLLVPALDAALPTAQ